MSDYNFFIHKHTQSAWSFVKRNFFLGRKFGVKIKDKFIEFGETDEDRQNALIASQSIRLLEHTQAFYDYLQEGLIKENVRSTLESIQCFNYQKNQ